MECAMTIESTDLTQPHPRAHVFENVEGRVGSLFGSLRKNCRGEARDKAGPTTQHSFSWILTIKAFRYHHRSYTMAMGIPHRLFMKSSERLIGRLGVGVNGVVDWWWMGGGAGWWMGGGWGVGVYGLSNNWWLVGGTLLPGWVGAQPPNLRSVADA